MKKSLFAIIIVMLLASLITIWQIGLFTSSTETSLEAIKPLNHTNLTGFSAVISFSSSNSSNSSFGLPNSGTTSDENKSKTQSFPGSGNYWHGHSPGSGGGSNSQISSFSVDIGESIPDEAIVPDSDSNSTNNETEINETIIIPGPINNTEPGNQTGNQTQGNETGNDENENHDDTYCVLNIENCGDENEDGGNEETPVGENHEAEVPEFSTIAAGVVLVGAGFYISRKRESKK